MALTTALDLITATLRRIGVQPAGQAVVPEEAQDALDELNLLLEEWGLQGRLVPRVTDTAYTLTGAQSYTIGSGGVFNGTRPTTLHDGFTRIGEWDQPYCIVAAETYYGLQWKQQSGPWPELAYYEEAMPLGRLFVWPVAAGVQIHLLADATFTPMALVTDLLNLQPGYRGALLYALGKRLAPEYGKVLSGEFLSEGRRAEEVLRRHTHKPVMADMNLPGTCRGADADFIYTGGF